jgi:hypothetical protein
MDEASKIRLRNNRNKKKDDPNGEEKTSDTSENIKNDQNNKIGNMKPLMKQRRL